MDRMPRAAAALALWVVSAPAAHADLIFQVESFTLSGGTALLGFDAFDPALGTLDRVSLSVFGNLAATVVLAPGQTTEASITWDAFGLGRGFAFDPLEAAFRFPLTNPNPMAPLTVVLATPFDLSFTLTNLTDLTGFVPVSFGAAGAIMIPPQVAAQRDDFTLRFPGDSVMEQFLFLPPSGVPPVGPVAGGGAVILQYEFTPAAAVVPEPAAALPLAALGLGLALGRRRGHGPRRAD